MPEPASATGGSARVSRPSTLSHGRALQEIQGSLCGYRTDSKEPYVTRIQPNQGQPELTIAPRSPAELLEPARPPEPPPRHRRKRLAPFVRRISAALTLVLALMGGAGGLLLFVQHMFERPGPLTHSAIFAIPRGQGVNGIAGRLASEGIISDRRLFAASHLYYRFRRGEKDVQLKAGEYEIEKGASMQSVLATLIKGRSILYKLAVPEGLTSQQIVARLKAHPRLTGTIEQVPAEGSLLADTYKFTRGLARQDLLDRMRTSQQKLVDQLWARRQEGLPIKTRTEAVILASIVERETGRADERERVAGVFVNRLKIKMRLQSDPTIIYGIAGGKGTLGRPILRSEIARKTAYNTYQIDGLPPTPICNPGRFALQATLNPAKTKDLYFVADGTGGHAFATSHRGHLVNVVKWRKIERARRARRALKAAEKPVETRPATPEILQTPIPGVVIAGGGLKIPLPAKVSPPSAKPAEKPKWAVVPVSALRMEDVPLPVRKPRRRRSGTALR